MIPLELKELTTIITKRFKPEDLPDLVHGLNEDLDFVGSRASHREQVAQVIQFFDTRGRIEELLEAISKERPNVQEITDFLARWNLLNPGNNPPIQHPWETLSIHGLPFIARAELRQFLSEMSAGNGHNILLVNGKYRQIGKTYSQRLVKYLSERHMFNFVPIDLNDLRSQDHNARALAEKIAAKIKCPRDGGMPEPNQNKEGLWCKALAEWLIPESCSDLWWLVLDGFKPRVIPDDVRGLVGWIANRVHGSEHFKLILIDYDTPLPPTINYSVLTDKVVRIRDKQVTEFLKQFHLRKHGQTPERIVVRQYEAAFKERRKKYYEEALTERRKKPRDEKWDLAYHALLNRIVYDMMQSI
jgi:hypothetical protein